MRMAREIDAILDQASGGSGRDFLCLAGLARRDPEAYDAAVCLADPLTRARMLEARTWAATGTLVTA